MSRFFCIYICLITGILGAPAANSQVQFGMRAGTTVGALYSANPYEPGDGRLDASIGAFLDIPSTGNLALRPELGAVWSGGTLTTDRGELGMNLMLIEVPAFARYRFDVGSNLRTGFYAGPLVIANLMRHVEFDGSRSTLFAEDASYGLAIGIDFGFLRRGAFYDSPLREMGPGFRYTRAASNLVRLGDLDAWAQWLSASVTMHL